MKENEFLDAVSYVEPDVVERFVAMDNRLQKRVGRSKAQRVWMRVGVTAACVAVILGAVLLLPVLNGSTPGGFLPPISLPFPGGSPNESPTPDIQNSSFDFDSYRAMIRGFQKWGLLPGSDSIQGIKDNMGEAYAKFVDKVKADGDFPQPMLGDQPIPYQNKEGFSNITFFANELYGMPWVWYHCLVDGERVNVQITYPSCLGIEVNPAKNASEMLEAIAPNAVNLDNFGDRPSYKAVYLQNIPMASGNVSVLVYELKNSQKKIYTFFMGEALVMVTDYEGVMVHKLWKQFSVGEAAPSDSSEENTLLPEGEVTQASFSSLPEGYAYSFQGTEAQAIADYLRSLHLISDFTENPYEYFGMTWVISLEYADGSTLTVYHFGNLFIRAEDGPWYKMEYEEADRLNQLLAELNRE